MTLEASNKAPEIVEQIPGYEVKESTDPKTGFKVVTYCPEGGTFNGTCDVFFSGFNNTHQQTVDRMDLKTLLPKKTETKNFSAFSIVIGSYPGAGKDKYATLSKKGAFSSMMQGIEAQVGGISKINLSANSAGGEGILATTREIEKNCDPIADKIRAVMMGDASYSGLSPLAKFAGHHGDCQVAVKYLDFPGSGTATSAVWLKGQKLENVSVEGEKVKGMTLARHLGSARDGLFEMAGLKLTEKVEAVARAVERTGNALQAQAQNVGDFALARLRALSSQAPVSPKKEPEKSADSKMIEMNGNDFKVVFKTREEYRENRLNDLVPADANAVLNVKNKAGVLISERAVRGYKGRFYDEKSHKYIPVDDGYTGTIVRAEKQKQNDELGTV